MTGAIAVLGTASDVGKSLLTTALGRLLSDAGLDVVPFKAQNMSLQSGVTADGGEMSHAHILQAHAWALDSRPRRLLAFGEGCSMPKR